MRIRIGLFLLALLPGPLASAQELPSPAVLVLHKGENAMAIIDPANEPSKRVAARLGMTYEATYTGAELGHRFPEIVVDLFVRDSGESLPEFPMFDRSVDARPITLDDVKSALDDD